MFLSRSADEVRRTEETDRYWCTATPASQAQAATTAATKARMTAGLDEPLLIPTKAAVKPMPVSRDHQARRRAPERLNVRARTKQAAMKAAKPIPPATK